MSSARIIPLVADFRRNEDYDILNLYDGMDVLVDGLKSVGHRAFAHERQLTFDDFTLPRYSVVVKHDDANGYGFLIDVPGYNLVTYWKGKSGYNWKKIAERIKMASRAYQVQSYKEAAQVRRIY